MFTFQPNLDALPYAAAGVISLALGLIALRRRDLPRARAFGWMMAGETAWALSETFELLVVDSSVKRVLIGVRVLGASITVLGLAAVVLHYTGRQHWLKPGRLAMLAAPNLVFVACAWTNPWHHLYWSHVELGRVGEVVHLFREYGPIFWLHIAYGYGLVSVCTYLLAGAVIRSTGVYRAQAAVMLFGAVFPWGVSIIDLGQFFGYFYTDTVAAAFTLTGLAFLPSLLGLRLLDLTPVAWAAVVERMGDPVVVIDQRRRIASLNLAAARLIGRTPRELIGCEAAWALASWPALSRLLERLGGQGEQDVEIMGPPSLEAVFDARISRLGESDDPSGWVLVLRDISVIRRAEQERLRRISEHAARLEAERSNQAKDEFLATLSHELRTPLTPVLATVTAMLRDPDLPPSVRGVMEMIRRNVELQSRLIDDLLDLTRVRRGKLLLRREAIDAHDQIRQVVEICREELCAANLDLHLQLEAKQPFIHADPARIQQVLWNLIKNAIKFTPPGGSVSIRSRNQAATMAAPSGLLILEVEDTGMGIEPELLPRIFDLFEQGGESRSRRSGGLGLGLSISRSIVEQHQGRLVAISQGRGRGARFVLELPSLDEVDLPPLTPEILTIANPFGSSGRSLRILLVDDHTDTLQCLAEMIGRRGHRVYAATTLAGALGIAREVEIDLLISDIELPDGSGLELMWRLRSEQRAVHGIALSGFGSSDDIELSRSAGFIEHLTKPIDFARLEQAIQAIATTMSSGSLAPQ